MTEQRVSADRDEAVRVLAEALDASGLSYEQPAESDAVRVLDAIDANPAAKAALRDWLSPADTNASSSDAGQTKPGAAAPSSESVTPASEVEPLLRTFDPARLAEALWETSVRHNEAPWVDAPDVDRTGTLGWAIVILDYLGIGAAAAVPAVTPRTEDEFRERACPSCGEVLAPADTHWDLMADRYLCAVPAVIPASTGDLLIATKIADGNDALPAGWSVYAGTPASTETETVG